jgi:hypothetical protein
MMNYWKIGFWVTIIGFLASMLIGFYCFIDQASTITYMQEGYDSTESDLNTITVLINETDLSKTGIMAKLQEYKPMDCFNLESDTIDLERVLLIFKKGQLKQIEKIW